MAATETDRMPDTGPGIGADRDELLGVDDVAALLHLHDQTIRRYFRDGVIPGAMRIGWQWRIPRSVLIRLRPRGNGMATEAVRAVWSDPRPLATEQLVMVAIAWSQLPRGGSARISLTRLATMTGLTPRGVQGVVARLVKRQALRLEWARPGHTNRYAVNVGDLAVPVDIVELDETPAYQPTLWITPVDTENGFAQPTNPRSLLVTQQGSYQEQKEIKRRDAASASLWIPEGSL